MNLANATFRRGRLRMQLPTHEAWIGQRVVQRLRLQKNPLLPTVMPGTAGPSCIDHGAGVLLVPGRFGRI
jgi:hypothetical protein